MRIFIKAKPNSSENKVDPPSPGGLGEAKKNYYTVSVKDPPVGGRANRAIVRELSEYFHTPNVRIVSGHISRQKIVEVDL
ncbi:MAG: hypothetical protein A2915_02660 [Candidatus Yanofskybacteria bacterium RIFCSPLOWO2_01_FULL_41_34]|uniref:Uncharacterized protein n=1 Tax=Candidatus Yanofskybacteria bacterium RIFCSPHIGHO2_01_FULL_41_26 TaxID=1802661 RepID=A0A1F8EG45_9BACT|nr:MAG: hypothetical protein A2649_03930 [Candidatus Yanofskybacteria bacterium RIFCSPHIGHO2_01_FULL_41_26]OGN21141.1 MAG: hypothetical protein A2915_02660 [Candidatus Yanofskybacteria bacterium RIFCSPLOWO2_01_FULL_41_34]